MSYEITRTELVWPGKYNESGNRVEPPGVSLPFQVIERVNESRATRETRQAKGLTLFDAYEADDGETFEDGWRNKLIWGDNALVMSSLLDQFAGKVDLIYIDPPFATGSDFSFKAEIGGEGQELLKERSLVEDKAYRDTWRGGYDTYLPMLLQRLVLLRDLLTPAGSIFVHLDVHTGPYVKVLLDEVFGQDNFQNEIAWYYYNKMHDSRKRRLPKAFDQILYYVKSREAGYTFNRLEEARDQAVKQLKRVKVDGVMKNARDDEGHVIYQEKTTRTVDNVWRIRCLQPANKSEWVNYENQKPVDLMQRVLEVASEPGDLVLDAFCGSGSTLVASEIEGRRWIGCDLGRYAIHLSRKRLLDVAGCRPFEVLNLGQYERQYWQASKFGEELDGDGHESLLEYIAFILKLYGASPLEGSAELHGQRGKAFVHVGAVESPITMLEVASAIDECLRMKGSELHVLGWEWEMGLNDTMTELANGKGVRLILRQIPREVMEAQAATKGDITFYELAYLDAEVKALRTKREYIVRLSDFLIPNPDLIPEEVRRQIKKWSDFVDYWAVDWDFCDDTFMQSWATYRTRRDRTLALESDPHLYETAGEHAVMIKVIDIFGNDTSKIIKVRVK